MLVVVMDRNADGRKTRRSNGMEEEVGIAAEHRGFSWLGSTAQGCADYWLQ
jgi:hypothetical protein